MSKLETFMTSPIKLSAESFYPRNYNPTYLFVKEGMSSCPMMSQYIVGDIKGGSTPPAYFFYKDHGIPFIKTSAVSRHFINVNDLQLINKDFHSKTIKRSITYPYNIIYTMTGKFMGKAAMCPPTILEMNMSQNSVVLCAASPKEAAFLTIYLNSQINKIQVCGTYSITKQKYMNQGKIANLKVMKYDSKYDTLMQEYINAFDIYYYSIVRIQEIISEFNKDYHLSFKDETQFGFVVKPSSFDKRMLVPNFYRPDVEETIAILSDGISTIGFDIENLSKGDEIGSINYLNEGIPFIKTSDIINFDVDYEPDCYCSEAFLSQLEQDIKCGDIIFTKDGKPGEVAIIQEDNKIIISSGLVKYRARNIDERYWVFLLLSSKYGESYFKKWFVIGSTMLHLRTDFFDAFVIPEITYDIKTKYIEPLKQVFNKKLDVYLKIAKIKTLVEETFTNPAIDLSI
ncbi:hypothetical protein [Fusobacterium vincentii]|uniref:restriction endonuclease subunit S n=1 Tax=Fusobacterium vincentii TaxID=155615 RepID=UPI0032514FC1